MNFNAKDNEKSKMYINVQSAINEAKSKKYAQEYEMIKKEGMTFLGNFNGKNDLQIQRLKNLNLKIQLLQITPIEEKKEISDKDLMADLYACAIVDLGGEFTPEMNKIYNEIKVDCEERDKEKLEEDVYLLATEKISNSKKYLPIIHEEKTNGIYISKRTQAKLLKVENKKIQEQIIAQRGKKLDMMFV